MDDEVMQKLAFLKFTRDQQLRRLESGMNVSGQVQLSFGATNQESSSSSVSNIMICDRGTFYCYTHTGLTKSLFLIRSLKILVVSIKYIYKFYTIMTEVLEYSSNNIEFIIESLSL